MEENLLDFHIKSLQSDMNFHCGDSPFEKKSVKCHAQEQVMAHVSLFMRVEPALTFRLSLICIKLESKTNCKTEAS